MALTKPKASQINFDLTNISDPIIRLNSDKAGANDTDIGFIFERGTTGDNAVILWDESADKFVIGTTTATGSAGGDITTTPGTINVAGVEVNGTSITTSLDGLTATATELNYVAGVTSAIQTQIDAKGTGTVSSLGDLSITATATELNYVDGVTSSIQTQLDAKAPLASPALTGTATAVNLTLSGDLTVNGTTTTVNTTNLVVTDNLIELNNGAASNANDSGIVIERGSTGDNAIIAWDESADAFVMGTTTATGASTGDLTITAGALSIGSLTLGGTAVTSTAAELNLLDGVTATTAEINYLDGVTSNIQTQIDGISGGISNVVEDTTPQLGGNLDGQAFNITTTGTVTAGGVSVGDNEYIYVGAGNDLAIWHDGTNTLIRESGAGSFYIDGTNLNLRNGDGTATFAHFANGGAATLYHNNSAKLATASGGVTVTGTVTATSFSGTATEATNVTATANNTTDETVYITFVDGATGTQGIETDTGLTYNPSSNTLTTSVFSGTATTAQYADLAELYVADAQYEPGTVLIFGGQHEVTASRQPDSNKIAGVVSTAPGVLMNKDCAGEYVVALAFTGRVPTKVKGTISKGDMMVSSNIEGVAVASDNPAIGTVIGKALENYDSEEVGVIEVVVGRL